eukprot:symbB.v1.2.035151.t1/scaffold4671.1/size36692/4
MQAGALPARKAPLEEASPKSEAEEIAEEIFWPEDAGGIPINQPAGRPMLAMPSPTASSLAATMPNLSRSGRRAVKRRKLPKARPPKGRSKPHTPWWSRAFLSGMHRGSRSTLHALVN